MFSTVSSTERFIACQPWFASLNMDLQEQLRLRVYRTEAAKGEIVLPAGTAVEGWYAVMSGLVMLRSPASSRRASAFIGVSDGDWFGEGSAMKPELRKYEVVALRGTQLLCLPLPLFTTLHETSLAFNQFLVSHMNLRLGQALSVIEAGRMRTTAHRVALYLSRLFWSSTRRLNLTQEELGQLCGLSRQTVNRELQRLEAAGIVSLDFGRVVIVDDAALLAYLVTTAED